MMNFVATKHKFENAGYYFVLLFVLAVAGFWPSYFSHFFDGTADFDFYFHFHVTLAIIWIFFLIIQPVLIRKKMLSLHRLIGRTSYILVPLLVISIVLLAHSRIGESAESLSTTLWIPFKDLFIFIIGYGIAIAWRRQVEIHARGMIMAGIVLIEPALLRFIQNVIIPGPEFVPAGYLATILVIYFLLIGLIVRERHQKKGRWVFPLALGLFLFVHTVLIFQIEPLPWKIFAEWFAALPLT